VTTMTTSVNIGKKPAPVTLSDIAITKVAELLAQERARPWLFGLRSSRVDALVTATKCSSTPR